MQQPALTLTRLGRKLGRSEPPGGVGRLRRWVRAAGGSLLLVILLGLVAVLLIPAALGYKRYVITGGSMSGAFERGSVVFDREVPVRDLRVGDIITYDPPNSGSGTITHRIVWVGKDEEGERAFRTKGDANPARDPWLFNLSGETQAQVAFSVPYVGYGLAAMAIPKVRYAALGVPALLIALWSLVSMWRTAGEELRRRQLAGPLPPTVEDPGS